MRWVAVLCLPLVACSLAATRGPESPYASVRAPPCSDSPAPVIGDFALAVGLVSASSYLVWDATAPNLTPEMKAERYVPAAIMGAGAAALIASGVVGVNRLGRCGAAWEQWRKSVNAGSSR